MTELPTSASALGLKVEENPPHGQVDGFQPQSTSSPYLPAQEPFSSTVSNDNKGTQFVLCKKSVADLDEEEGIILQETEGPESQTGSQNEEVDMADSFDPNIISIHVPEDVQEKDHGNIMKDIKNEQTDQISELMNQHSLPGPSRSSKESFVHLELEKNMETRLVSKSEMTLERDQSENSSSPSLAQALKELHKLLMSNSNAQTCAWSPLSATHTTTPRPDTDEVDNNQTGNDCADVNPNYISSSHTAITHKTMFANSEFDALEEDSTFEGLTVSSQRQEGNETNGFANIHTEEDITQCPEGNEVDENGEGLLLGPEKALPAEPSLQQPLSVAVGPSTDSDNLVPEESSYPSIPSPGLALSDPIQPSTLMLSGQYPAEHIQRIEAAGFSSREAAEALEQAEGSVELALLVLLARKITVPT
ncbi:protein DDI1 homolog 2 isoform 1-T1 [Clarias gariepinus]